MANLQRVGRNKLVVRPRSPRKGADASRLMAMLAERGRVEYRLSDSDVEVENVLHSCLKYHRR